MLELMFHIIRLTLSPERIYKYKIFGILYYNNKSHVQQEAVLSEFPGKKKVLSPPMAQWLRCLTSDRKVASSHPSTAKLPLLGP